MSLAQSLVNVVTNTDTFLDAAKTKNAAVLGSLLGPAYRGFVRRAQREGAATKLPVGGDAHFDWTYAEDQGEFRRLYRAAKQSQWDADTALDWATEVDPVSAEKPLLPPEWVPMRELRVFRQLTPAMQREHVRSYLAWVLSQFLHGEQGALYAATEVTQAVPWFEGKLYGATQVVDEARHLEVFHRYLDTKLRKSYRIDDNLYVIIDALVTDARFDIKFLGMQIMIEGLALGAFGVYRRITQEPLLKDLLRYVITDEARHVHYGVVALKQYYATLPPKELREREDWAFELALLMRNRFLAHELFDEGYAHAMTRREWDAFINATPTMGYFRKTMFERIIPNLKRIGLLSERVKPYYAQVGLLDYEHGKAAPELTASDLLGEGVPPPPTRAA